MRILVAICCFVLASWGWGSPNLQEQLFAESQRREQLLRPLQNALVQGEKLAAQGETLRAWQTVDPVWKETPPSLQSTPTGQRVLTTLAAWEAILAETEAGQSQWPKARDWALRSLDHNPANERATQVLTQANGFLQRGTAGGEAVNPALTNRFFDKLQGVRDGIQEAEKLRETGQLDLAETRFEEVLRLDPFNSVATEGIRKIAAERALVGAQSRDLSNLERRREVREIWNNIYPKRAGLSEGDRITGPLTSSSNFDLEQKLKKIRIPQVDFSGADLETIRRALNSLSRQYDNDPEKSGINFIISAEVGSPQPVSLRLKDVSLEEVVRYVCQIAGVKSRLSEVGVTFRPLIETRPDLIQRVFTVSPSFFNSSFPSAEEGVGSSAPRGTTSSSETESPRRGANPEDYLKSLKVEFPPGAQAVYNPNTSQLKVVNNAEMLDLIGQLIAAAEEQTVLVQVALRLIEINQNDLDSITVNTTFGTAANIFPLPAGLTTNNEGVQSLSPSSVGVNGQLDQIQGVGLLPNNTLQSFLQAGVLASTNQSSSYALNSISLGGFLNTMQFSTLITAIAQKSSANVLASPSIILKRGQKGVIEVTQDFRYVKEYNEPQYSIRTIEPAGGAAIGASIPGPETVIGSFPSDMSDVVPIGVVMDVEPDVNEDLTRVGLKLRPSFVDFEGFINYGAVINSAYALAYFTNTVPILTNNIQQPVFVRRDLDLPKIEMNDGYTLLLGGLLREDIQSVDEKVPILGDIPLVGRAFQGKTQQAFKKNTLIFVTPRILQLDGRPMNPTAGVATTASTASAP